MSFDLNLTTVCNHRIYRELSLMDDDQHSLRMARPLASSNVSVYATGNLVPKAMYNVIFDTQATDTFQTRLVYFKNKWKSPTDFFEITYVTYSGYCPKCTGLKTVNDVSYDVRGDLKELRDEKLLLQNVEKFVVTQIRSNPFHSFIGTSLVGLLGEKIADIDFLSSKITQEINTTLQKLMDMQGQYKLTGRVMTNGETLASIDNIEVYSDENDPTILRADVTLTAKSGKSMTYTQLLNTAEG